MSETGVPEKTKIILWGKAAGRCQYEGCNVRLYQDPTTKTEFNMAYIAHIVADSPKGPRGHEIRSKALATDIGNLMLLCDRHHRLIDKEQVEEHDEDRLQKMKADHEKRVDLQTAVLGEMQSHLLLYGANTGQHSPFFNWSETAEAISPQRYPADKVPITISLKNNPTSDSADDYWKTEIATLRSNFNHKIKTPLSEGMIHHLSVFAIAPQPLLIELGVLLGDINRTEIFQKKREPQTWAWLPDHKTEYKVIKPITRCKQVALKLELSSQIGDERITKALGSEVSIWSITHAEPGNDYLKSKEQLEAFRNTIRSVFAEIKKVHGEDAVLNIFPAAPVSTCVELGKAWMPKADLPFHIYEQNTANGGFYLAHTVRHT